MAGFLGKMWSKDTTPKKYAKESLKRNFVFWYRANAALFAWNDTDKLIEDSNKSWCDFQYLIEEDASRAGLTREEIDEIRRSAFKEACENIDRHFGK